MKRLLLSLLLTLAVGVSQAFGTVYHVKKGGSNGASGTSYANAWATIEYSTGQVVAGDTVKVYTGKYTEAISIDASGTADNYIVFTAATTAERCTIQVASTGAITATDKSYNKFLRLTFVKSFQLFTLTRCSYFTIEDCRIDQTGLTYGSYKGIQYGESHHITINRDTLIGGFNAVNADCIAAKTGGEYGGRYIVVSNCYFTTWGHYGTNNGGTRYLMYVGNYFTNNHGPWMINYNGGRSLVAFNSVINYKPNPYDPDKGGLGQIYGDSIIVRYNVSAHSRDYAADGGVTSTGAAFGMGIYENPASNAERTRVYNNTFWVRPGAEYLRWYSGIDVGSWEPVYGIIQPVFKNNIIVGGYNKALRVSQTIYTSLSQFTDVWDANMFYGAVNAVTYAPTGTSSTKTVAATVSSYPTRWAQSNTWAYPTKIDSLGGTWAPEATSNVVDVGTYLTTMVAGGYIDARRIRVSDPIYFFDGWGMLPADSIYIKHGAGGYRALLTRQGQDTLYFNSDLPGVVSDGDSITVLASWNGTAYEQSFYGTRPDIGAVEYIGSAPPAVPTILISGALSTFSSEPGVPSAEQTYTVAGSNLEGNILISSPSPDFQISTTPGSGFGSSLTLIQNSGNVGVTTIYVRMNSATEGSKSSSISHTSINASPGYMAASGTVASASGGEGPELLSNVSWETGTTGWTYYDNSSPTGAYTRQTSPTPYHGTYLARVVLPASYNAATPNVQLYSAQFSAVSGTQYRFRYHIYGSASTSIKIILLRNSTGGTPYGLDTTLTFTSSGWKTLDKTFTCSGTGSDFYIQNRFRYSTNTYTTAGTTVYIDSVSFVEANVPATTPTITVSSSMTAFSTVVSTPSSQKTYTVSGTGLTDNIDITAPSDFEISSTSGSGFGTSVSLAPTNETVETTTIYVRMLARSVGNKSGNISHVSDGAAPQTVTVSGTVSELTGGGDDIEKVSDLSTVWFVDDGTMVKQTDTLHWMRSNSNNYIGNYGAQDTVRLFSMKNEMIAFQIFCVASSDTVDSVAVWIDSLRHVNDLYTIKNDSGRSHTDPFNFAGRPIEMFVQQYPWLYFSADTTTWGNNGRYAPGGYSEAQPIPNISGEIPVFLVPSEAAGNRWYDFGGQGGYPFFVPANRQTGVWCDIYVSRDAPTGYYEGRVRVVEGGKLTRSIPIKLGVYDFTLTDSLTTRNWMFLSPEAMAAPFGNSLPDTYSAGYWKTFDNFYKAAHRNLFSFSVGTGYYILRADSVRLRQMGYYTGWKYSLANGYDGVGKNLGDNMFTWMVYEMPKTASSLSSHTPSAWDYLGAPYNTATIEGWQAGADYIEDMFVDSTGDASMSYIWRSLYGPDEITPTNYPGSIDTTKTRITWVKGSSGYGKNLYWTQTADLRPEWYNYVSILMTPNNSIDTAWWGHHGYAEDLDRHINSGSYLNPREIRTTYPGSKIGWYNAGVRQSNPQAILLDVPLTEGWAQGWLNYKYGVDAWFHWQASQNTEFITNLDLWNWNPWLNAQESGHYQYVQDHCNDAWTTVAANVTANTNSRLWYTPPGTGKYIDSLSADYSVAIAATGAVSAGVLAMEDQGADSLYMFPTEDGWAGGWAPMSVHWIIVRANRTFQDGDLAFIIDNTSNGSSPKDSIVLTGLGVANRWTLQKGSLNDPEGNLRDVQYIGLRSNVALSALDTIWVDYYYVSALRYDVDTWDTHSPLDADVFVHGKHHYLPVGRGINGPIFRHSVKSIRRGAEDVQYFTHATRLGINVGAMIDSVVGGAFGEMGTTRTGPYAMREYWNPVWTTEGHPLSPDGGTWSSGSWGYPTQKQWRDTSWYYETVRRALSDSLVTRSGGTPLQEGPRITVNSSMVEFSSSPGVPSAEQTYTVSGQNLTADITISPPADFEISETSGSGFVGFGSSLVLTRSGSSVEVTTIYVRMNSASEGNKSGNISHTSTDAATRTVTLSGVVSTPGTELIDNVSWETNTSNWTYYDNSTTVGVYSRETIPAPYHGTYLAQVALPSAYDAVTPNVQLWSSNFTAEGGIDYRFRAHVYGTATTGVQIRFLRESTGGSTYGLDTLLSFNSSGWKTIDKTFTNTATGVQTDFYIQFLFVFSTNVYTTAGTTVYIDSVSVIEAIDVPGIPTITLPTNGQTDVNIPTTIQWSSVGGATSYHLQVDTESGFVDPLVFDDSTSSTSESGISLGQTTTYYARVHAKNDAGVSAWSGTVSFTTLTSVLSDYKKRLINRANRY